MTLRASLVNTALFAAATLVALLLGEFAARLILNPPDYLSVEMVHDDVLGAVPAAGSTGSSLDAWGFRNRAVPLASEIVVIGDSHTYGNTAAMDDSWPHVLGRLAGRPVYNMGMGGYGPNQYVRLLETKALRLQPKTVIVGLYVGDDFENAFLISYGLEHWAHLRALRADQVNYDIWQTSAAVSWHKRIRIWLSRHSVLYQLVLHGPLLGRVQGEFQIRNAHALSDSATTLAIPARNILEAFRPAGPLRNLDQDDASVREGMRITFGLLARMNEISRRNGVRFLVVVIPTKEMVFAEFLLSDPQLPLHATLVRLIENERRAREATFGFLAGTGIAHVDVLPALRRAVDDELYARTAADMHPSRNGYKVIAEAVFEALKVDEQ